MTLSSFRGRQPVLLAFFPLAFTSTCTAELCEMRDDYDVYAAKGVAILPISVDSVPTLREYKRQHAMQTDLLSDFKREATNAYGVMWKDAFFANRSYFLVDREGVVRWAHGGRIGVQFGLLGARETHVITEISRRTRSEP